MYIPYTVLVWKPEVGQVKAYGDCIVPSAMYTGVINNQGQLVLLKPNTFLMEHRGQ